MRNHWKLLYATSDPKIDTVKEKNLVVDKHQLKCSSFHYFQTSKKKCVYNLAFSNAKWLWWRSWAIFVWSECYDTSWQFGRNEFLIKVKILLAWNSTNFNRISLHFGKANQNDQEKRQKSVDCSLLGFKFIQT